MLLSGVGLWNDITAWVHLPEHQTSANSLLKHDANILVWCRLNVIRK